MSRKVASVIKSSLTQEGQELQKTKRKALKPSVLPVCLLYCKASCSTLQTYFVDCFEDVLQK